MTERFYSGTWQNEVVRLLHYIVEAEELPTLNRPWAYLHRNLSV
jgi:hypothetical protein